MLTRQDYEILIQRTIDESGKASDSDAAEWIRDAYFQFWESFSQIADQDGDKMVNRSEYLAFWLNAMENRTFLDQLSGGVVIQLIKMFDQDSDGKLSFDEWAALCRAYAFHENDIRLTFDKLDQDADGLLTFDGLVEMNGQYYYSENADDPGNWMWGKLK
jgi:Ca2+-binding EF-hand superfamily protein